MSNSNIAAMQAAKKAKQEAGEAEILNPLQHAMRDSNSLAKAVKAQCFECVGRGEDSGTRREIGNCTAWRCPLWQHRPYQKQAPKDFGIQQRKAAVAEYAQPSKQAYAAADPTSRRKAVAAFCWDCMGGENPRDKSVHALVENCNSTFPNPQPSGYCGCPFWPHRLKYLSKKQKAASA